MAYDQAALSSYVRFYVTVVTQLEAVWSAIDRSQGAMREALAPGAEALKSLEHPALVAALGPAVATPPSLGTLWRPADPEHLTGLNDLYEVAGRFAFQGDDNENLGRVQSLVATARNELHGLRARLTDLQRLPEAAMAAAARQATDEGRAAEQRRTQRASDFGPLAQTMQKTARQTVDAVRAVPLPELTEVDTAADEYRKFSQKLDGVYQTCLPYLRKGVQGLYQYVGAEPPAAWPDSLPLVRELPPELLAVPPADSPELQRSRSGLSSLDEEEMQLGRARDDLGAGITRLEGEIASLQGRDGELKGEQSGASALAEYAAAHEQLQQMAQAITAYEQQKLSRQQALGEIWQRHQQIQQAMTALEEELRHRAAEIAAFEQEHAEELKKEPALFGKEHWRARVSGLEDDINNARVAFTQRNQELNKLKIDHSAMSVQVQTEQSNSALIDRWIDEGKKKREGLEKQVREMASKLGAQKPGQAPSAAAGQRQLDAIAAARAEVAERVERLRSDIRRRQEEQQQISARLKQIETERQRVKGMVDSAQVAATQGREAALKQLAAQRRSAVERHVADVLGSLEKSLSSVEDTFIEPARRAMLATEEPAEVLSARLREGGEKVAPVVESLLRSLEPELLAQDAMLGQIQREFCDVAPEACRQAWSS